MAATARKAPGCDDKVYMQTKQAASGSFCRYGLEKFPVSLHFFNASPLILSPF
ncbi:hypothetical protein BRYFOR_06148 [Marvinbryantia formatexigens DSM 14469]|uniref:Uncharacterized protein n=1 Tax=Marvinbryantia formatexigens DSM 14469 TaxID=478749 RepID=C6LC02_9FIRM|nr:hypothetical protein BRYFOR_06148 [Marvinbryantia formatexigens DSM 14469]